MKETPICGLWADTDGNVRVCHASPEGERFDVSTVFKPFLWTNFAADFFNFNCSAETLKSPGTPPTPLNRVLKFPASTDMEDYFKKRDKTLPVERILSVENQFLLSSRARMFSGMKFANLRRVQVDIEVESNGTFPSAKRREDRIIAVGISGFGGRKILEINDFTDAAERALLDSAAREILKRDPDLIEGHNIFNFDLPYIAERCRMVGAKMNWGRFGASAQFRKSRLNIAERIFAYTRCDIPGRSVVDTMILVQLHDISAREMPSYGLKAAAVHFGISEPEKRTYLAGGEIGGVFKSDRKKFRAYLSDDLRETAGLSELLLPTYVAQVQNFPMTLQECLLRGTGAKVESLFLEKYLAAKASLPLPAEGEFFEGALSESFETGVFKDVLHYDVASLYPSLMLVIGKCPRNDYLKVFLEELRRLREYRLKYKALARETADPVAAAEFDARQKSFKILINSFYGYLGLSTAIFGDTALAAEITRAGRELLTSLMDKFRSLGCRILEADTDGIYISSTKYFPEPFELLKEVSEVLPKGVDLDCDGEYKAMLCYKAKNYALLEGDGKITMRGSALRNRATEPFLRSLTETLVRDKLLDGDARIHSDIEAVRRRIESGTADVSELAKGEFISRSPSQYEAEIAETGRGRRASMEAALKMSPRPLAGEKVSYYIARGDGKKSPDWKRAMPTELFDSATAPYDADYYLKKIDDWLERFSDLAGEAAKSDKVSRQGVQGELFS